MARNNNIVKPTAEANSKVFGDPSETTVGQAIAGANMEGQDLSDATPELQDEKLSTQKVADQKVFKGQAETFEKAEEKQSVTLDKATLDNLLNRLNDLEGKVQNSNTEESVSLLKNTKKEKQVRVSYYVDPMTAETFLLSSLLPVKLPTGTLVTSYKKPAKDPVDGAMRLKDHMKIKLTNLETMEEVIKEVVFEEFIQNISSRYYYVKSESKNSIDLTPSDEEVIQTFYTENDRYIKREQNGLPVKVEVQGSTSIFTVEIDGKDYSLPENVINFR